MNLNHLNLTVNDVPATVAFLETYFGLRNLRGESVNPNFTVMLDDSSLALTLMKAGHNTEIKYPGQFHIGFVQASEDRVNDLYERFKADGFDVQPPQRAHAWTFYVQAPGGFTVEVLA
jgi:catechol 2,3-dioxygenase-like lactoylglutathione lyase family enzyme